MLKQDLVDFIAKELAIIKGGNWIHGEGDWQAVVERTQNAYNAERRAAEHIASKLIVAGYVNVI